MFLKLFGGIVVASTLVAMGTSPKATEAAAVTDCCSVGGPCCDAQEACCDLSVAKPRTPKPPAVNQVRIVAYRAVLVAMPPAQQPLRRVIRAAILAARVALLIAVASNR